MFGYVEPLKDELRVRELTLYQAHYCGLCKAMGTKTGQLSRLTLNYDCTFLSMLLAGLYDCPGCQAGGCVFKPFQKKRPTFSATPQNEFVAALSVMLAYHKLVDDWIDEKKLRALFGKAALYRAYARAKKQLPGAATSIEASMEELRALERSRTEELDAPADAFGRLMSGAIAEAPVPDDESARIIGSLCYNIGKWVYLCDAWDDRARDGRTGAYNPFLAADCTKERAARLINHCLNEAIKAYDLLDIRSGKGVLDNIMYEGCTAKTIRVLGGVDDQSL